jgi:hypothetical protein
VESFNSRPLASRLATNLNGADLTRCELDGVRLDGVSLNQADLSAASLVGAVFGMVSSTRGLKGARFVRANLSEASLDFCPCQNADFTEATLRSSSFRSSNCQHARFIGADLTAADLTGADLRGADLTGTDLRKAVTASCLFDDETKWPKAFRPPSTAVWKGKGPDPRLAPSKQEKRRPRPNDYATFLERLQSAAEKAKLDKALDMLQADRFRLFARVLDDHVVGVVKSQSDPTLVYSCRLTREGIYTCCTQNLNVCGGLRGSPCKHLLVLILGLVMAGELDPASAHDWTQSCRGRKPELDRDVMTETLLQYKGAEAGEIDWRPTDTLPEDFYAM